MVKALVLFSGGLDSLVTVKLLQEQNIDVEIIHFILPFGCRIASQNSINEFAKKQKIKLHLIDITKGRLFHKYLKIITSPKHGTGTAMNPCRDCKIFIFSYAKTFAKKINADIIATGEVLSQRPMSQIKQHLLFIEKKAGLENKILRPLSAKKLPKTLYEQKGLVDTDKLFAIQGRRRKVQMNLAKKYQLNYPMPGGGCLLCEKDYCKKLKDLFCNNELEKISFQEIRLLSNFRHFRSKKTKAKVVLGKNKQENLLLEEINKKLKWNIIEAGNKKQPTVIYQSREDEGLAEQLISAYSNKDMELRKRFQELRVK